MSESLNSRGEFLKAVFGNKYRLDIWAAIGRYSIDPPEPFFYKQIKNDIEEAQVPTAVTWKEMQTLSGLGSIERVPEAEGVAVMYHRLESPVWEIVQVAFEAVSAEFSERPTN